MPPELAALIFFGFIAYLFWRELSDSQIDKISWVPFAWMFIAGSRFVSRWLNMTPPVGENGYLEGSPIDRAFFLSLIVLGLIVLYRRHLPWGRVFGQNKWLLAYLGFCLCSVLWAEDGFVLFKRWIKDLGNPIMALILLTERRPWDAIAATFRRLSFLVMPLSVLFIKYYPEWGRFYTRSGAATYTGVADQKNTLGLTCLIIAICYLWTFVYRRDAAHNLKHWSHVVLIGMTWYLFNIANSQTAFMCLLVAASIILLSKRPAIAMRPGRLVTVTVCVAVFYMVADATVGLREHIFSWLGRNETLTNRTAIWEIVRTQAGDPWIGVGFMSFWEGTRVLAIAEALGAEGLNQAHNGYLEQWVNLGYVGVSFVVGIALVSLLRARRQFTTDYPGAVFRFCILLVALLYNYTEASFYGINNIWILFLASALWTPQTESAAATVAAPAAPPATVRWGHRQRPAFARSGLSARRPFPVKSR